VTRLLARQPGRDFGVDRFPADQFSGDRFKLLTTGSTINPIGRIQ